MSKVLSGILIVGALIAALWAVFSQSADVLLDVRWVAGLAAVLLVMMALLAFELIRTERQGEPVTLRAVAFVLAVIILVPVAYLAVNGDTYDEDDVISEFLEISFDRKLQVSWYRGAPCLQFPNDQWIMQEIISELKPDFLIETGTWYGTTALYYADLLEKVNPEARVITIDIEAMNERIGMPEAWDGRVDFIHGSSVDPDIVASIAERVQGKTVLVTLDSDHHTDHVYREMELYWPLVSVGSYLIVQDTALEHDAFNPGRPGDMGPREAVRRFLDERPEYVADLTKGRYLVTSHPFGFLKRVR
jgi:cephalosporin hydroxylase